MIVYVDWLLMVKKRFAQINAEELLQNIKWFKEGKEVIYTPEEIKECKLVGLNNTNTIDYLDSSRLK